MTELWEDLGCGASFDVSLLSREKIMQTTYKEILTGMPDNENRLPATEFHIITKKGSAHGIYIPKEDKLFIHGIMGKECTKGIMNILINKFKTRKFMFTPLITDHLKEKIRGTVGTCKAGEEGNPYGEDIEYLEGVWEI